MKIKILLFIFILLLGITSCTSSEKVSVPYEKDELKNYYLSLADEVIINGDEIIFKDLYDKEIKLTRKKFKTISLYASFTTLWYEAGGEVIATIGGSSVDLYLEYIGRDITKDDGVEIVSTTNSGKNFDIELILALNPDLIICSDAMNGYQTISEHAKNANIDLIVCDYEDFRDYLKWFKIFSFLNYQEQLFTDIALTTMNEIVDIVIQSQFQDSQKVLSIFSSPTPVANTNKTLVGRMIEELNSINIISDVNNVSGSERVPINLEAIYEQQPTIILINCHQDEELAQSIIANALQKNPIWNNLDAVKMNRVYYLPKELFHNKPNRRFVESYRLLFQLLYGKIE